MASIFATTAEVARKAGDNVSTTSIAVAYVDDYMTQVESFINVETGYNWSDAYAALDVDVKGILKEASSNLAAIYALNFKPTGQDGAMSRIEYEDRVNILFARFVQCMDILTDIGTQKFMTEA